MSGDYSLSLVIALLIMVAVLAFVCWPLFQRVTLTAREAAEPTDQGAAQSNTSYLQGLVSDREAAYRALQDLDLERQLGNIGAADYTVLRDAEMERAIAIMRHIDALDHDVSNTNQEEEQAIRHTTDQDSAQPENRRVGR